MATFEQVASGMVPTRVIDMKELVRTGQHIRTFARIFVHPEGHSLGEHQAGRRAVPSGSFASTKAGVAMPWLRHPMRVLVQLLECNPNVVDYRTFPHRLEYVKDGRAASFIPDAVFDRIDGAVVVICFRFRHSPTFAEPAEIYRAMGWQFELIEPSHFDVHSDRAHLLQRLLDYKHVHFSTEDAFVVRELLRSGGGKQPLEDVARALGEYAIGVAKLCAMTLRRIVALDLRSPLEPHSWVTEPQLDRPTGSPTFKLWERYHG
ncbi:MAG: hypothetical protein ACRCY3_11475 [Sphingorhabdus sp.]